MAGYTSKGYRVIALASKKLESKQVTRRQAESDLTFLGLFVLGNELKSATRGVIQKLHNCDVRTVMATGDNLLTACAVARQCGMVKDKKTLVIGDFQDD